MYVEMLCGSCDGTFSCDAGGEDAKPLWGFMQRFANAHVMCGYMAPAGADDSETDMQTANIPIKRSQKRRVPKNRLISEEDDE
jgi:hypothetical protein